MGVALIPFRIRLFLVVSLGLICIAFGSILVRLSQEAPPLVIAFYRMTWASLLLLPIYGVKRPRRAGNPLWWLAAGIALALHFAFWITSLAYTSVAVSVLLVNTSPVLVAAVSYLVFKERLAPAGMLGMVLALGGSALLAIHDLRVLGDWRGPALALAGAAMLGTYLILGRQVRLQTGVLAYVYPTYLAAALILGLLLLVGGLLPIGYSRQTHLFLFLLGLVPQSIGHTAYNWALRYLPATLISTLVVAEPVLATLLAYWILEETVGGSILLGGGTVGLGIFLVSRYGFRPAAVEVAVAILKRGQRVWIQQRSQGGHLPGLWEFPGGKLCPGESPREALVRELREELGLHLSPPASEPLLVQEYSYPGRRVRLYFYLVDGSFQEANWPEGRWVDLPQLKQLPFPPANRTLLEKLKNMAPGDA